MKQFIQRRKSWLSLSMIIVAAILVTGMLTFLVLQVAQAAANDFTLSLTWMSESGKTDALQLQSARKEDQIARMRINYKKAKSEQAYAPGEIVITVPGLKGVSRDGKADKPAAIAADPAADGTTYYDWSYTYSSQSDTYTLTNNFPIHANSPFEGWLEIVWALPSRTTKDGFEKTGIQATLRTAYNEQAKSDTIRFQETRERDTYTVKLTPSALYSAEGLMENVADAKNYTWVKYTVSGSDTYKARDVNGAERFELCIPEHALVQGAGLVWNGKTQEVDGRTCKVWEVNRDITNLTQNPYLDDIFVAYPTSVYPPASTTVRAQISIKGTYFDETQEANLATDYRDTALHEYDYLDLPGDIYKVDKRSHGGVSSDYVDKHCSTCQKEGCINGSHIGSGAREYMSSLYIQLNYREKDSAFYDLEFVDDLLDVELQDGSLRLLEDDEYNFTKVVIPGTDIFRNINNIPIQANTYPVEVYVRKAGTPHNMDGTGYVKVSAADLKVQTSSQTVDLPADTVSVKIVIRGMKESIRMKQDYAGIQVYYKFHSDDPQIQLNSGKVINNMYFKLYDAAGTWANSEYDHNPATYTDRREYERDLALYQHTFDREKGTMHVLEIPNEFRQSTDLERAGENEQSYLFTGSLTTWFSILDDGTLDKFSMYTMTPPGMGLSEMYYDPAVLKESLTFSSAYMQDHCTVEVIPNYKGSGRAYIGLHFDISDLESIPNAVEVSGIPFYASKDTLQGVQHTYSMYGVTLLDDFSGKWFANQTDSLTMEDGIWRDIDQDGNSNELAASGSDRETLYWAAFAMAQLTKAVQSELTEGFVQPGKDASKENYLDETMAYVYNGREYQYKLRMRTGENLAKRIILYDVIETGPLMEWQGEFLSVDYTEAMKTLGTSTPPTVYYSTQVEFTRNEQGLLDNEPNLSSGGWTTTKPAGTIRSIAIDFGNATMGERTYLSVIVKMRAPANANGALDGKISENNFSAYYDKHDKATGAFDGRENLHSNDVPIKLSPYLGILSLYKEDAVSTQRLPGAVFDLYKMKGDSPNTATDTKVASDLTTDENGRIKVTQLEYGFYYFVETEAPLGYSLVRGTPQVVELNSDAPNFIQTITVKNPRKPGQFTLRKYSDRISDRYLAGAVFSVYSQDGALVQDGNDPQYGLTTNGSGELTVNNLPWGSYYLQEIKAPAGYELSEEKIPFDISAENDAGGLLQTKGMKNEQKPAMVEMVKYEMLEDGNTVTSTALDGAAYRLYFLKEERGVRQEVYLGTYMTDNEGKLYADDLTFGEYYFQESIAAQGFALNPDPIGFTIDETHTEVALKLTTADARLRGKVWLQKKDDAGVYVKDAKYGLFYQENDEPVEIEYDIYENGILKEQVKIVHEYVTDAEGIIEIENLPWGEYYLKEIEAPRGYELNDEIYDVIINRESVNARILHDATDARGSGSVEILKVSEADENLKLAGAVFTLYRADGSIFMDDIVTEGDGKKRVDNIPWGSYYFQEKTPPAGYGLNPDKHRFSINYLSAGHIQEITITDPQINCELKITKRIKIADIVFAHGDPTFTFKIEGTEMGTSNVTTYYRTVVFTEDYVKEYQKANPAAEYVEQTVILSSIPMGKYLVTEEATQRYELDSVEIREGYGTKWGMDGVEADLETGTPPKSHVAFTNEKVKQSDTTHTVQQTNIVKLQRKLTAIVAVWNGPDTVTEETLDRTLLDVYAIYDDGVQTKLADDAYDLDPAEFDQSMNGDYVVKVKYTEGGITRTDSFALKLNLPLPFTWYVISSTPFTDTDGTEYAGTVSIDGYTGKSKVVNFPASVQGLRTMKVNASGVYQGADFDDNGKTYKVVSLGRNYLYGWADTEKRLYSATAMETLRFPDTLQEIKAYAFWNQSSLDCALPAMPNVTKIGTYAFYSCAGLTGTVNLPKVEYIYEAAFRGCSGLTRLESMPNVKSVYGSAFYECSQMQGSVDLPQCTFVGSYAFYHCQELNGTVNLPVVGTVDGHAFEGNKKLTGSVNLPECTNLGSNAFRDCSGLDGTLNLPKVPKVGNYAFYGCRSLTGAVNLPSCTEIEMHAFGSCKSLTGPLSLPLVNKIWGSAFSGCEKITGNINLPECTEILDHAFYNCTSLDGTISLPKVQTIGKNAFTASESAKYNKLHGSLNLPLVQTIGEAAFIGCNNLTGNISAPECTTIDDAAFKQCAGLNGTLYLPKVKTIGSDAFFECPLVGSINFPECTKIGPASFQKCRSLDGTINLPKVEEIGSGAFWDTQLTGGLSAPNCVKIEGYAFYGCYMLDGVVDLPECTDIGTQAFASTSIASISFPKLEKLGVKVFWGNSSLTTATTITIPESCIEISDEAFSDMSGNPALRLPNKFNGQPGILEGFYGTVEWY